MSTLIALVPIIVKLIGFAESFFTGAKQGDVKKSAVMGAAQAVVEGMTTASTGGQKETWQTIAPLVGNIIDTSVAIVNAAGWTNITDDTVQDNMRQGL